MVDFGLPQEKNMVFANVGKDGSRICPGGQGKHLRSQVRSGLITTFTRKKRCLKDPKGLASLFLDSRIFQGLLGFVQFRKALQGRIWPWTPALKFFALSAQ
jgi:hypothetical protein